MKKQKDISLFKVLLFSFFSSWGLFLSISTSDFKNSSIPDTESSLIHFLSVLRVSFHDSRYAVFFGFIAVSVAVYMLAKHIFSKKEKILAFICGGVSAVCILLGLVYKDSYNDLSMLYINKVQMFRTFTKFIGLVFLCTMFVLMFFVIIDWILRQWSTGKIETITPKGKKKVFGLLTLAFIIARIPYFILFFPGLSAPDTWVQIQMYFDIPTFYLDYAHLETPTNITNHHPYFTTLIFGIFSKIGIALGNINIGFALFSFCQITLYALVFAGLIIYLKKIGVSKKIQKIVFWFLMLFPMISMMSVTMVKDSLFGIFNVVFLVLLFEIVRSKGQALKSVKFNIFFFFSALLLMLTKNQGIYFVLIVFVIYLIKYRKFWKQLCATLLVAAVLFQGAYINVLLPALNVAPGGKQEMLSVPFQQTARYVVEHGDEVTAEEKEAIAAILPYDELTELYDPELSDDVKFEFNQESTTDDLMNYFKVWFKMFFKEPFTYINATLNNTFNYYSVSGYSNFGYYKSKLFPQHGNKDLAKFSNINSLKGIREAAMYGNYLLQSSPGFSIVFDYGFFSLYVLFICADFIRRRKSEYILAMLLPILTNLVNMVCPDNGNFRYFYPLVLMLPFVFATETLQNKLLPTTEKTSKKVKNKKK